MNNKNKTLKKSHEEALEKERIQNKKDNYKTTRRL